MLLCYIAFRYISITFFQPDLMIIWICVPEIFKIRFLVHDNHLNLCVHIDNGYCVVKKLVLNVGIKLS